MAKMNAAVVREFGAPLDLCEVEKPEVKNGKIVVKVVASGVCHTDLHAANGDWPVKTEPAPSFQDTRVSGSSPKSGQGSHP